MALLIIPILVRVAAGALSRGAGTAIARWSAGNVVKKYVATAVAEKAIDEGRKMVLGQSQRWQTAFKEDPGEAMRGAVSDFVSAEARDVLARRSEISSQLISAYREQSIEEVGREVERGAGRGQLGRSDTIIDFDPDAVIDRTTESILSRGLSVTDDDSEQSIQTPLDEALNGKFEGLERGRSLATYAENPIDTEAVIRSASRSAFTQALDERALTQTVVGTSDSVQREVQQPIEELTTEIFDINEPIRS